MGCGQSKTSTPVEAFVDKEVTSVAPASENTVKTPVVQKEVITEKENKHPFGINNIPKPKNENEVLSDVKPIEKSEKILKSETLKETLDDPAFVPKDEKSKIEEVRTEEATSPSKGDKLTELKSVPGGGKDETQRRGSLFHALLDEKSASFTKALRDLSSFKLSDVSDGGLDDAIQEIEEVEEEGDSSDESDDNQESDNEYDKVNSPKTTTQLRRKSSQKRNSITMHGDIKVNSSLEKSRDTAGNKRINQYVLIRKIGEGQFGHVRLCKDLEGNEFAVKTLNRSLQSTVPGKLKRRGSISGKKEAFSSTEYEVAIMKKIRHPNVVRLFEVIDDPQYNKVYLVMEYVTGGSSMLDIDNVEPLGEEKTLSYARGAILGLDYLHRQGIVHGDIKPSNILVDKEGNTKITDFGTSLNVHQIDANAARMGSPAFMAPELLAEDGVHSGLFVDIWAMGVTLYMFMSGRIPFRGRNHLLLIQSILDKDVECDPHWNTDFTNMIKDCMLQKNPNDRQLTKTLISHPWLTSGGTVPLVQVVTQEIKISAEDVEDAVHSLQSLSAIIKLKRRVSKVLKQVRKKIAIKKHLAKMEKQRLELARIESGVFLKHSHDGGILWGESKNIHFTTDNMPEQGQERKLKDTKKHKHKKLEVTRRHSLMSYRPQDMKAKLQRQSNPKPKSKLNRSSGSGKFSMEDMLAADSDSSDDSDYDVDGTQQLEQINDFLGFADKVHSKGSSFNYVNGLSVASEKTQYSQEEGTEYTAIHEVAFAALSENGGMDKMEDKFTCSLSLCKLKEDAEESKSPGSLAKELKDSKTEKECCFFAVYDGHDGDHVSEFLAEGLHKAIAASEFYPDDIPQALREGFAEADDIILEEVAPQKGGSTAIVVIKDGNKIHVANLGDCRAVLCRSGKAIDMSTDHKPDSEEEKKRIESVGGWIANHRLNGIMGVARAFGDIDFKNHPSREKLKSAEDPKFTGAVLSCVPEVRTMNIDPDDEFLVLACDGLWDVLSSQEVVTCIKEQLIRKKSLKESLDVVFKEAMDRNTIDNVTIILIRFCTPKQISGTINDHQGTVKKSKHGRSLTSHTSRSKN